MPNFNEQFVFEMYSSDGLLTSFELHYDDHFNFGVDVVDALAELHPDKEALVWCNPEGDEHRFTFADIKFWSDKTACLFQSQGIKQGDKVMVVLRRHYQFWFVAVALSKLGAVMVPATFMLKEHDLSYRLEAGEISAIVASEMGDFAQICDNVIGKRCLKKFLVNGTTDQSFCGESGICRATISTPGWLDFNALIQSASTQYIQPLYNVYDPMLMYFSSGTSGQPKMVLHNSTYALAHLLTAKHWHNVKADGLHLTIADTGWGKAVWGKLYGQWLMESAVMVYDFDRFNPSEILDLIARYSVTTLCCPPTMYRMMISQDLDSFDLSSLQYCTTAGEALNPDLFDFWYKHTGLEIHEGYGQTETPLTIANLVGNPLRPGSMGKPVPQYHISVLRADGTFCSVGETGEICVDISQKTNGVMMCYYKDEAKTMSVKYDGWYHTGDMAWVDEDGYYWYVGRNDDVIKSSGYRIGPFEIESVLLEHGSVKECAVTGVPDEVRGMAVKATIVLNDGFVGDDDLTKELQKWVKNKTAPYKYPRVIDYVTELPKTTNGKIQRAAIRESDMQKRA